jgi:hypothetical protein
MTDQKASPEFKQDNLDTAKMSDEGKREVEASG